MQQPQLFEMKKKMTTKKKTIDVLERTIAVHEILQQLHGDLPILKKLDAEIQSLIENLKAF